MDVTKYDCTVTERVMEVVRVFQQLGGTANAGRISEIIIQQRGVKTGGGTRNLIQSYCPQCPGTYNKYKKKKIPLFEKIGEGEYKLLEENVRYLVLVAGSPRKESPTKDSQSQSPSQDEPSNQSEIQQEIDELKNKRYPEGTIQTKEENSRKRSKKARTDRLRLMMLEKGYVHCEICLRTRPGYDGFFDVDHYEVEIGQMDGITGYETKLTDLKVLCPNCHRDKDKPDEVDNRWFEQ